MPAALQKQPSRDDMELAHEAAQRLLPHAVEGRPLMLSIDAGPVELPAEAVMLLVQALEGMAAGRLVSIVSSGEELTTQEAADVLNVSRPFLVRLLEERQIPFRKVGTHRRIRAEDVRRYKDAIDAERRKVLDELVAEAQELGMGY